MDHPAAAVRELGARYPFRRAGVQALSVTPTYIIVDDVIFIVVLGLA